MYDCLHAGTSQSRRASVGFESFYENYGPNAILAGASTRYVSLNPEHN